MPCCCKGIKPSSDTELATENPPRATVLPTNSEDNEDKLKQSVNIPNLFNEYCENTTIHGVKYFGERHRPKVERWWWIAAFLVSIVLCTLLIRNLWVKWDQSPVIVSFAERSTPVWEIPFPAVTICPETKATKSLFNYTDIYHRISVAIFNGTEPDLTFDE